MNIYDIAKESGVSIATVSRVLNGSGPVSEKTREKVNKVMTELGYTPNVFARGLMVNSMKLLGILTIDVQDLYHASAIHTIEVEARQRGYDVLLCSTGNDLKEKKKYLKLLLQKRVDGIILIGSVFKERTDNSHIHEASRIVPVVMVNGDIQGNNIYSLVCDDAQAVYSTVSYLVEKERRNLVYLYDVETFSGMEKLKGLKKSIEDHSLNMDEGRIIKTPGSIDGGYNAIEKLISQGIYFDAVVTAEDSIAAGALKKLQESGKKVPQDVSVVGFNNSILSRCTSPELTSVDNKVEAISSLAIKTLIDVIESKNSPSKTVVLPELVLREST